MDNNVLTMIGVLGGTLIVAMVLLYFALKTGASQVQGSQQAKVTNRSALPSMVLPEATRV